MHDWEYLVANKVNSHTPLRLSRLAVSAICLHLLLIRDFCAGSGRLGDRAATRLKTQMWVCIMSNGVTEEKNVTRNHQSSTRADQPDQGKITTMGQYEYVQVYIYIKSTEIATGQGSAVIQRRFLLLTPQFYFLQAFSIEDRLMLLKASLSQVVVSLNEGYFYIAPFYCPHSRFTVAG
jgi:hypothetical protein